MPPTIRTGITLASIGSALKYQTNSFRQMLAGASGARAAETERLAAALARLR